MISYMQRGNYYRDTILFKNITNGENFLKFYLRLLNIPRHVSSVKIVRVRANGKVDKNDCALFLGSKCKNCYAYEDYANLQNKMKYKKCLNQLCFLNGRSKC